MKVKNPMVLLQDMAQEKLKETTRALGNVQQVLEGAISQHQQLQSYERDYQHTLRAGMMEKGMSVADLINHQSFILSLNQVVKQHERHLTLCENAVDQARTCWITDKQKLNAFETLNKRRDMFQAQVESRKEQKMMDEFAQRAALKRENL